MKTNVQILVPKLLLCEHPVHLTSIVTWLWEIPAFSGSQEFDDYFCWTDGLEWLPGCLYWFLLTNDSHIIISSMLFNHSGHSPKFIHVNQLSTTFNILYADDFPGIISNHKSTTVDKHNYSMISVHNTTLWTRTSSGIFNVLAHTILW